MKLLFVFALCFMFIYAEDSKVHKKKCTGVHINGKFHKKEILTNGINRPYQLSLYHHKHELYFSYNVGEDTENKFEIAYLNLNDERKMPSSIPGIKNGFATALDEDNKLLYFGGSEGIFVDNLKSGDIQHILKGHDIWDMFFKDHLYFINYPSQRLHKLIHNSSELLEHIDEQIYQFAVDGDDDIFITTKDGLREIKNGSKDRISYDGPNAFRAIEIDRKGVAHFCAKNTIYVANKENHTLEEIAHVKNIFGLTFDKDNNIIYSDPHEIVKLLPEDCK